MKDKTVIVNWARIVGLALGMGAFMLLVFAVPGNLRAETDGTNAISNPGFESGTTGWTCNLCILTTGAPAQNGAAAQLKTTKTTGRAQMFQKNITLQPNTTYELRFWARSEKGSNLQVSLQKQTSPFTNYGIAPRNFDVTSAGQEFTYTFTTSGFSQQVSNARLRLRTDKGKGLTYSIDNVSLTAIGNPPPPPPPPSSGNEMLIYDWNKPITIAEGGFAMDKTSKYLSQNWVQPVNYADGSLHFRARINGIPKNQPGMKIGFCFWQTSGGRENCKGNDVPGIPGTVEVWDFKLSQMWKKDGKAVDWSAPRTKMGFSIRDSENDPVSNKTSSNWGGNNPADWYSMNLRVQVVLVPAGATFSGWQNYP